MYLVGWPSTMSGQPVRYRGAHIFNDMDARDGNKADMECLAGIIQLWYSIFVTFLLGPLLCPLSRQRCCIVS